MEGPNPRGRRLERIEGSRRRSLIGPPALLRDSPHRVGVKTDAIKPLRLLEQRRIATRPDAVQNGPGRQLYVRRYGALSGLQVGKKVSAPPGPGRQQLHARAPSNRSACFRICSINPCILRYCVLRLARLTMSRAGEVAISSTSTSPFFFRVWPGAPRAQ